MSQDQTTYIHEDIYHQAWLKILKGLELMHPGKWSLYRWSEEAAGLRVSELSCVRGSAGCSWMRCEAPSEILRLEDVLLSIALEFETEEQLEAVDNLLAGLFPDAPIEERVRATRLVLDLKEVIA